MWSLQLKIKIEPTIALLFTQGCDYDSISLYLQEVAAGRRGFSTRSVRRLCSNRGMRIRHNLSGLQLDQVVRLFVGCVGHSYGRRTLQGLLRSYGIQVSQRRIASSLRRLAPFHYKDRRQDTYRLLNPVPYPASHYGKKLHLDQNKKLVSYSFDATSPMGPPMLHSGGQKSSCSRNDSSRDPTTRTEELFCTRTIIIDTPLPKSGGLIIEVVSRESYISSNFVSFLTSSLELAP